MRIVSPKEQKKRLKAAQYFIQLRDEGVSSYKAAKLCGYHYNTIKRVIEGSDLPNPFNNHEESAPKDGWWVDAYCKMMQRY